MVSGFVQVKQVIFSGKRHENILLLETLICRDNLKKVTRRLEFRATGKKKRMKNTYLTVTHSKLCFFKPLRWTVQKTEVLSHILLIPYTTIS